MDIVGPIYRIEDELDTRPIRGGDWDFDEEKGLAFHKPTKLLFAILMDETQASAPVPLMSLAARPIHSCDGAKSVTPDRMERIAKDAIHMFFLFADVCLAAPIRPEPDPCRQDSPDDELPF